MNKKYIINSVEVANMINIKHSNVLVTIRSVLEKTNDIGNFIEDYYSKFTNNGGYKKILALK